MKLTAHCCLSLCISLCCFAFLPAQEPLTLEGAWILDGRGDSPVQGSLRIEEGRIAQLGEQVDAAGRSIDLTGLYLLPGFIDAHVHVSTAEAARTALHSGVTTARSMGTSNYADVGLRELIRAGAVEGPEILAAGYHLRPRLAEPFFFQNPGLASLISGLSGPEDYRRAAAANLDRDVDFLKVVATDRAGLPETDPRRPIMTVDEIREVVELAAAREVPVAAHAHGDGGAAAAVEAGVRSIEHGTYLSRVTLELMRQRGTFLVPTLAVVKDLIHPGGDYDSEVLQVRGRHMYPRLCEAVRQAHALGVPVVASTDTGYGPRSILRLPHDLQELVACGLSPAEAIRAATSRAAELLGIGGRTGTIAAGMEADLIAVDRNPLEDIGHLQDVLLVISDGKVVVDRLYDRAAGGGGR